MMELRELLFETATALIDLTTGAATAVGPLRGVRGNVTDIGVMPRV